MSVASVTSVVDYVMNEQKIQAIKDLRAITGLSLKEAKDAIDSIYDAGGRAAVMGQDKRLAVIRMVEGVVLANKQFVQEHQWTSGTNPQVIDVTATSALLDVVRLITEQNELLKDILEALSE